MKKPTNIMSKITCKFTSLKIHGNSKNIQLLVGKSKSSYPLHKYCPATIGRAFSPEFVFDGTYLL